MPASLAFSLAEAINLVTGALAGDGTQSLHDKLSDRLLMRALKRSMVHAIGSVELPTESKARLTDMVLHSQFVEVVCGLSSDPEARLRVEAAEVQALNGADKATRDTLHVRLFDAFWATIRSSEPLGQRVEFQHLSNTLKDLTTRLDRHHEWLEPWLESLVANDSPHIALPSPAPPHQAQNYYSEGHPSSAQPNAVSRIVPPPTTIESIQSELFGERSTARGGSIVGWLRPEAQVIPVQDRREYFQTRKWLDNPKHGVVRLIYGPGGQGKTHLGYRLIRDVREGPWIAGFLATPILSRSSTSNASGSPSNQHATRHPFVTPARTLAKLRQLQGIKALFVIDYSEFRGPAIAKLIAMLEEEDLLPRTRILLLARTAGEWWRRLQLSNGMESHIEPLAHQLESVLKGQDAVSLDKLWKRSTSAFAAAARNAGIPCVDSPPRPERTSSYTTLGFYADALLSTVDTGDGRLSGDDRAPLARLLGHERRYFGSVLAQSGLSIAGVQQDWALATCSLRLPSSTSEAMLAVSAVEMLGEVDAAALTDAIATAFPSSSTNQVWAGLSLDPVVDLLLDDLASSARTDTDWLRNALGMFADLDDDSGLYAAQVLTRALRESKPGTGQERLVSLLHELILVQPNSVAAPICISDPPSQLHEALSEAVMSRRMDSRHFAVVSESMSCLLRSIMTPELTLAVRRREAAESRWHAEEGTGEYRTYVRAVIDLCLVLRVLDRAADTVDELGICVEVLEDAHARDGDKLADLLLAQLEYIEALYLCDRSEAARPVIERVRHLLQKQVPEVRIDPLLSVQLGGFVASVSVLPDGSNYEAVGFEHRKALERLVPDPRSAYAIGREWGRYSRFAWAHRDVSRAITAGLRSAEVFSEFGFAEKRVEQLAILSWCWQRFGDGSDPDSLREIAGYLWDAYSELAGYRKEGLAVRVARGLHPIIEAPPVEMAGHDYYVMVMMAIRALTILDEREQADSVLIADYVTHLAENLDRCPKEDVLSFRRDADDIVSAEIASNPEIFCELGDTVIGLLEGAGLSGSQRLLDAIKIAGRAPGGTTGGG